MLIAAAILAVCVTGLFVFGSIKLAARADELDRQHWEQFSHQRPHGDWPQVPTVEVPSHAEEYRS